MENTLVVVRSFDRFDIKLGIHGHISIEYDDSSNSIVACHNHINGEKGYRIDKKLHNKIISFFTNIDVIKAFGLGISYKSISIKLFKGLKNTLYGNFVGFGGKYIQHGIVYELKNNYETKNRRKSYLEKIGNMVLPLEKIDTVAIVSPGTAFYHNLTMDVGNKTVYFNHNGKDYKVLKVYKPMPNYMIEIEGFGTVTFSEEQLMARIDDFSSAEVVVKKYTV